MTKKNQDSLDGMKLYDGQNQSARNLLLFSGKAYNYPNMRMETHRQLVKSLLFQMQDLHGNSKPIMLLTDSFRLIEVLAIMFEDTPLIEVVDMLYDMAHAMHEEKTNDNKNSA